MTTNREMLREAADELNDLGCGDPACTSCSSSVFATRIRAFLSRWDAELTRASDDRYASSPACAAMLARLDDATPTPDEP